MFGVKLSSGSWIDE